MASVQSALHAQLKFAGGMRAAAADGALSTAALMARISQQLYESTPPEKYATFFLSLYDQQTGRLHYTNAGHCPPILVRGGKGTPLEGNGMVVGLLPNISYEEQSIDLQRGDLVAIFSDGVPEAEDAAQEPFGEERLSELLIQNADRPLEEIVDLVTERVFAWAHDKEAQDDTTILLARQL
jgi:sigma-B regulation protein RsbU (phosphoserine phosphatase)